jgi:hypothetical protein
LPKCFASLPVFFSLHVATGEFINWSWNMMFWCLLKFVYRFHLFESRTAVMGTSR